MPRAKRLKSPPRRGVEWRRDLMLDDFGPRSFARSIRASLGAHHDALEFPDGQIILLTLLQEGQQATVLQLPATLERAKAAQPDKAKV